MRIVSKFKDYYDGVQKQGVDRSIVYIREQREIRFNKSTRFHKNSALGFVVSSWYKLPYYVGSPNYNIGKPILIGFCGKWHVCVEIYACRPSIHGSNRALFYSYKDMIDFSTSEKDNGLIGELSSKKTYYLSGDLTYQTMFDMVGSLNDDLFVELGCPIITVKNIFGDCDNVVTLNDSLREFDFARVKDPYQAYQDISMYVGGVLRAPEKETLQISDDCMRDKKGFDKWSFRKQGTK